MEGTGQRTDAVIHPYLPGRHSRALNCSMFMKLYKNVL